MPEFQKGINCETKSYSCVRALFSVEPKPTNFENI